MRTHHNCTRLWTLCNPEEAHCRLWDKIISWTREDKLRSSAERLSLETMLGSVMITRRQASMLCLALVSFSLFRLKIKTNQLVSLFINWETVTLSIKISNWNARQLLSCFRFIPGMPAPPANWSSIPDFSTSYLVRFSNWLESHYVVWVGEPDYVLSMGRPARA